jgi:hypothetical protein
MCWRTGTRWSRWLANPFRSQARATANARPETIFGTHSNAVLHSLDRRPARARGARAQDRAQYQLIGTLAYLIVELLPEWTNSRGAHQARRRVAKTLNPDRDIKTATRQLAVADTVQNSIALANQHLERSQFADARDLFARCLKGVYADDPLILLGLAKAQFGLEQYGDVIATLDRLKQRNPDSRSPEGHLLYARALELSGQADAALHEYEALSRYYPGPEPRCRLALILKAKGDSAAARDLFQRVLSESEVAGKHYNALHKEWVALARKEA